MTLVGSVTELRRYPVKSLAGEVLPAVEVDARGVVGDRQWAVTDPDGKFGSGKSSRRFRKMDGLLALVAAYDDELVPLITFPDGRRRSGGDADIDEALSAHVGRPVRLRSEGAVPHFDDGPLHLVTTASMAALAAAHGGEVSTARTRANLLVEVPDEPGFVEDGWVDRELAIGPELVVRVLAPMPRCVMVDMGQVGLAPDPGVLATLGRVNDASLGVVADVVTPGRVQLGAAVMLR